MNLYSHLFELLSIIYGLSLWYRNARISFSIWQNLLRVVTFRHTLRSIPLVLYRLVFAKITVVDLECPPHYSPI